MNNDPSNPTGFRKHFPFFHCVFAALFSPRCLKRIGFALLGLVTLIALFYAVENWRGARGWKKMKAELQAEGEPITFAELLPPMPPDDENFAMTPFFKGLFDKSIDPKSGNPVWSETLRTEIRLPDWPSKMKGARNWRLAQKFGFERGLFPTNWTDINGVSLQTNSMVVVVQQLFESARPAMDLIESAVLKPESQFPIHYEDNAGAILPHLSKLKGLGWLFSARASLNVETHDAAAALKDVETTLRLAEALEDEPILISGLVQVTILNLALQPVWQGLANGQWNDSQLLELQRLLGRFNVLKTYQSGMRGERIFGFEITDMIERDRSVRLLDQIGGDPADQIGVARMAFLFPRGWYDENKVVMARLYQNYSLPAVDPQGLRYYPEKIAEYHAGIARDVLPFSTMYLAKMLLPAVGNAAVKFALAQTDIDLAMTACALERYKLKIGHYPDSLALLAPDYLKSIPHDVVDGKPLRYRVEGDAFVLYSIGENLIDDGGVAGFHEDSRGKHWRRDEGDWVWKYPADSAKP